jgi:hypothetical protein
MALIVLLFGLLAAAIGVAGLVQPRCIVAIAQLWQGSTRFWIAILVRLVLGIVFLVVAPACRLPLLVQVIGAISIVAAVVILVLGQRRLDEFIEWWLTRPPAVIRCSAAFALAFGLLMIWAGM